MGALKLQDQPGIDGSLLSELPLRGSVAEWLACWTQAQKAKVQIAVATLSDNSLRQTVRTHCASPSSETGTSPLKGCGSNCRPNGK